MKDTLLIVDDEIDLLEGLKRTLEMACSCTVFTAGSGKAALDLLDAYPVDLVLTDLSMPGMDGMSLLAEIQHHDPLVTVILITGYGTVETAVSAIKSGAYDFIQKPFDEDRLIRQVRNGLERNRLLRENRRLAEMAGMRTGAGGRFVGRSRLLCDMLEKIRMLSASEVTVLVTGETGTGKDLAARTIHETGPRKQGPFVTVNCPALPEQILESELFGYKKGAFTGAHQDKPGLFDLADGGTLFLDEIGDLSVPVQTKLLRVLQDKVVTPLGETKGHGVDVRILTATNQDLEAKIRDHSFRSDLFYRLNVARITLPPLREIRDDIPLLVDHFMNKAAADAGVPVKTLSSEALSWFIHRDWPGNVRELENRIYGLYALVPNTEIQLHHLAPDAVNPGARPELLQNMNKPYKELKADVIDQFTIDYLNRLLTKTSGNVTLAARISGIQRQSLQKIIRRYGLHVQRFRGLPSSDDGAS
ncbi:MAG: DNA-binding response regulator [Deltaproteobacteria bacterium]|nr:MAG: DNA-binding response regulator [Deltaproteobacteria bacterium]